MSAEGDTLEGAVVLSPELHVSEAFPSSMKHGVLDGFRGKAFAAAENVALDFAFVLHADLEPAGFALKLNEVLGFFHFGLPDLVSP